MGHALMENRSGLVVAAMLTKATGTAEREAAEGMIVRAIRRGLAASPLAPTRAMTQRRLLPTCAHSTSHHASLRTSAVGGPPSMPAPPAIPATR